MAFTKSEFLSQLEDVGLSELAAALGCLHAGTLVSPDDQVVEGEEVEAIFYMKDTDYIASDGYFISPIFIASTDFDYENNLEDGQIGIQYVKFYDDASEETLNLFSATRTLDYEIL